MSLLSYVWHSTMILQSNVMHPKHFHQCCMTKQPVTYDRKNFSYELLAALKFE